MTLRRSAALLVLFILACSGASSTPDAGSTGGGAGGGSGGGGGGLVDAGVDAGVVDGGSCVHAPGTPDGGSRFSCTFNRECPCDERCDCDINTGCFCLTGPRGTGKSGIDSCDGGNQCESSLCVEGNGSYYCSGECTTTAQCASKLPICADVAFIGRICIRNPDGGN
jgi:hypothetical protein